MVEKNKLKQSVNRREPQQARSLAKVELMFEAALRILENEELAAFTTNRVAAVAGVSIGTLYQYFPDKNALLLALVQREVEATFARLHTLKQVAADGTSKPPATGSESLVETHVRHAVNIMVSALGGRLRARKRLMVAIAQSGHAHLLDDAILQHGLKFMSDPGRTSGSLAQHLPRLDFVQGFVLARAISGTLRAALLHDEHLLQNGHFADALCALIMGYLREQRKQR
jgi:AcrR family transcriptional regulator